MNIDQTHADIIKQYVGQSELPHMSRSITNTPKVERAIGFLCRAVQEWNSRQRVIAVELRLNTFARDHAAELESLSWPELLGRLVAAGQEDGCFNAKTHENLTWRVAIAHKRAAGVPRRR